MFNIEFLPLPKEKKGLFYYNKNKLAPLKKQIKEFLKQEPKLKSAAYAIEKMIPEGIKFNNEIEGLNDDIDQIEEEINQKKTLTLSEKKRILNLYYGYRYILREKNINKDTVRKLYNILSKSFVDNDDETMMGEYYRKNKEYITIGHGMGTTYIEQTKPENIESFMNKYFEFINKKEEQDDVDNFIKAQIIHLYLAYVHPYPDVNGRTSRTIAMWYLLNNKNYPYLLFNRAISIDRNRYIKTIRRAVSTGNITSFLQYMLNQTLKELQKESIIITIKENSDINISKEEEQVLNIFLSLEEPKTITNLAKLYNNNDLHKNLKIIIEEKIYPLIEKGILIIENKDDQSILKIDEKLLSKRKYLNKK